MEVATVTTSSVVLHRRMLASSPFPSSLTITPSRTLSSPFHSSWLSGGSCTKLQIRPASIANSKGKRSCLRASLSIPLFSPTAPGGDNEFDGITLWSKSVSGGKRSVVTKVIPSTMGNALEQPPPDLPSYLFRSRIIYLGMAFVPAVTELIVAEFFYLQKEDQKKPIYLYINSTGTTKGDPKSGYETEALAIYDTMRATQPPIFTLCVGNAWGEAALILAAGSIGNRSALPSSNIMIKQPIGRIRGQTTDLNNRRKQMATLKEDMLKLLAKHTKKTYEEIEADTIRPKYFGPTEAVEYGIIDKVLFTERDSEDPGVFAKLKGQSLYE